MDLYFSPMACSLASRITIYEGSLETETAFHNVTLSTKRFDDDRDYWPITAKGQVPALVTREGGVLTENAAVLQYLADLVPDARLAPAPTDLARYQLQQWLSFIGTELHKQVFAVIFSPLPPAEAKVFALEQALPKWLAFVDAAIADRPFLVGETFTVADAYLLTVLIWCSAVKIDLAPWSAVAAYHARMLVRPHVRRAIREERALYTDAVIAVPDSRLCNAATELAQRVCKPWLFNHVMRTYGFGQAIAKVRGLAFDRELFHVAAVLHDLGLTDAAPRGLRFEIAGADAAKELLAREGMREADIEIVWDAIALHTTVGLPVRKGPEAVLVQLGAALDVGVAPLDSIDAVVPEILEAWPRLAFKTEMLRQLEQLYDRDPRAALQSPVVADVVERRRGVHRPNLCDVIAGAAFDS